MSPLWRSRSLVVRITCLFALIVCVVVSMVGASLYHATSATLSTRADYQLIGRVEHFRSLLHDLYTIKEIEARPKLFETMLGDSQDVIIFRRPGLAPFISVNPENMPLPPLVPVPVQRAVKLDALYGAPTLGRIAAARVVDQRLPHRVGRSAKKMLAANE